MARKSTPMGSHLVPVALVIDALSNTGSRLAEHDEVVHAPDCTTQTVCAGVTPPAVAPPFPDHRKRIGLRDYAKTRRAFHECDDFRYSARS